MTSPPDKAILAVIATLAAAGNDTAELLVNRLDDTNFVAVTYNPASSDDFDQEDEQYRAYAADLRAAGWPALYTSRLVLIPHVPPPGTPERTYRAEWVYEAVEADSAETAAAWAREVQIDPGITGSSCTVTDHLGRTTNVTVTDPDLSGHTTRDQ